MLDVFEPTIWPFDMDIPFVSHWSRREYRSRSLIDHRLQYSTDVAKFRRTPIIVVGAPRWTGQAHVCRDCGLRSNYILRSTLLKSARSLNKRSAPATIHLRVRPNRSHSLLQRSEPGKIVSRTEVTCSDDPPRYEASEKLRSENGLRG